MRLSHRQQLEFTAKIRFVSSMELHETQKTLQILNENANFEWLGGFKATPPPEGPKDSRVTKTSFGTLLKINSSRKWP